MTTPSLVFALLIASLYGTLYHLIRDGGPGRLFLFLLFSWTGFAIGHVVGVRQEWILLPMGQLNVGLSTIGSVMFLIIGDWISRIRMTDSQAFPGDENGV